MGREREHCFAVICSSLFFSWCLDASGYLYAALHAPQKGMLLAGALGKFLAFLGIVQMHQDGVMTFFALLVGVIDLLFSLYYSFLFLSPSKPKKE